MKEKPISENKQNNKGTPRIGLGFWILGLQVLGKQPPQTKTYPWCRKAGFVEREKQKIEGTTADAEKGALGLWREGIRGGRGGTYRLILVNIKSSISDHSIISIPHIIFWTHYLKLWSVCDNISKKQTGLINGQIGLTGAVPDVWQQLPLTHLKLRCQTFSTLTQNWLNWSHTMVEMDLYQQPWAPAEHTWIGQTIPPEIGNFSKLEILRFNGFQGPIPNPYRSPQEPQSPRPLLPPKPFCWFILPTRKTKFDWSTPHWNWPLGKSRSPSSFLQIGLEQSASPVLAPQTWTNRSWPWCREVKDLEEAQKKTALGLVGSGAGYGEEKDKSNPTKKGETTLRKGGREEIFWYPGENMVVVEREEHTWISPAISTSSSNKILSTPLTFACTFS